ncbi:MAG: CHRD domain-containing protein [Halobacteriales archaeon]
MPLTRRRFVQAAGIAGVTIGGAGSATARGSGRRFTAHLAGRNEVPPVATNARGQATFRLDRDGAELSYRLIVANIEDVLMAHIHLGGTDENGPVVAWLYPEGGPPPSLIEGRFSGVLATGTVTADALVGSLDGEPLGALVDEIRAGNAYVNVHTSANPAGEVRGQIG